MSRRLPVVLLIGVCVLLVFSGATFAETRGKGVRAGIREALDEGLKPDGAEKFQGLPEWKKEAIRRVIAWMKEEVQKVRADDTLTPREKARRIHEIRKGARERIRRILRAGRHRPGVDDGEGGEE